MFKSWTMWQKVIWSEMQNWATAACGRPSTTVNNHISSQRSTFLSLQLLAAGPQEDEEEHRAVCNIWCEMICKIETVGSSWGTENKVSVQTHQHWCRCLLGPHLKEASSRIRHCQKLLPSVSLCASSRPAPLSHMGGWSAGGRDIRVGGVFFLLFFFLGGGVPPDTALWLFPI